MAENTIGSLIREIEDNYVDQSVRSGKYVDFDMHETIEKIHAYLNSRHISGDTDDMGRDKPFFNIVTASTNIWYRATDIDRKNIRIKSTKKEDQLKAFIATIHLQEFMRREAFGSFLNAWGLNLARYGSSVLKFVKKGGRLHSEVVPWQRLIVDPVSFEDNPVIEVLELTPAQLKKNKSYNKEMVKGLLDAVSARENLDGEKKDNRSGYIKIYEIHGELPLSYLTDKEEDEDDFVQQMHVVSFVKGKDGYEDFTLVRGKEKNPYMITHLIKEDGRTLGRGAVEHLFEAQWMVNHSQKTIKDHLDLASKLFFQTSDGSFASRNVLKSIESGDILVHAINQPVTQVNNSSHDVTQVQNFGTGWKNLAQEITSTPDAIMGNTFPSGTAYRQVEALRQEAHSLYEIMTENKGLAIEDMMRHHIIPFVMDKMDTSDEIVATLDENGIQKIDSIYVPNQVIKNVNNKIIEKALEGQATFQDEQDEMMIEEENDIKKSLAQDGNQRFIKPSEISGRTWKEELNGFEWDVEVEVTNETTDKDARLTTLTTLFQIIVGKQGQPMSPDEKTIFHKILREAGEVSPIELQTEPQPAPQAPSPSPMGELPVKQ
jgi:hypothetical protein